MNPIKKFNRNRWSLAFFDEKALPEVLRGNFACVNWMKYNLKDRWFADPFILSVSDDEIVVLVEELSYTINRGRLAKLIVDPRTYNLKEYKIILDKDTHLSFPMILRDGKDVVIIPENSASGKSMAYRYNVKNDELTEIAVVCDRPLTDATVFDIGDKSFMFATSLPDPNGRTLEIFNFDKSQLNATPHSVVKFSAPIARNAGIPFLFNGRLIRPAQDCDGAYGRGVILQELEYLPLVDKFQFKTIGEIYPFAFRYNLGLHTLNCHQGMFVIDGRGLLYPFIGRIVRPIINLLKR